MKKIKRILLMMLLATLLISSVGCGNEEGTTEKGDQKVVAEYEGGKVTNQELQTYIHILQLLRPELKGQEADKELQDQALTQYIGEKYALDQTKANDEDVNSLYESYKTQLIQGLGSEENYKKELTSLSLTDEDLKEFIKRQVAVQAFFENRLKANYEEKPEEFTIATVSHILISNQERTEEEAETRAKEVLGKLQGGSDFGQMAKEYSDDPGSKDAGGTYENYPIANYVPEFKQAALTLPIGEISDLVKTQFGYHILKVTERHVPKLEELDEQTKSTLMTSDFRNFVTEELPKLITKKSL